MKKKALSLILALASCLALAVPAFANADTTGGATAYLTLDPKTEIYAATSAPGTDYPYYGAKHEPKNGVYYGRTANIGERSSDGRWVALNESQMADESILSYYYAWNGPASLQACCETYFGDLLRDNARGLLIYFNFDGEADECPKVTGGQYDAKLRESFAYLATLKCPVFLRIGGEMNIWTNKVQPASFIAAYRHVADIGHSVAPNVAMVFSPNYGSHWGMDMDSFYPGDSYVDWIGVSLYYDRFSTTGDTTNDGFYGVNAYGDALLNVQRVISLAQLHKKPVMATEGGSANNFNGQDISAFAADRMARALSFLPMVYPQIKAIVSSDYHFGGEASSYEFFTNPTVTAAYRKAASGDPTLLKSTKDTVSYYTKLSAYTGKWEGTMRLAAYSWASNKLTATWYVDGQVKATAADYPYTFQLDTAALAPGQHAVTVAFSNGATKTYNFQTTAPAIQASNGAQVDKWAQDQVNEAISLGLVPGTLGADYRVNITRAQFAAVAVKLYEAMSGEKAAAVTANPFTDTKDPVVLQAADLGFVYGVTDTTFAPDSLVTREQAAAMLSRVYTKLGGEIPSVTATSFTDDASISKYARDSVAFMNDKGVISGMGGGTFAPKGNATIEQALSIALRMSKNLK